MSKHGKTHHTDHSGAHHRGTSYHEKHAHTLANGHASDEAENHEEQLPPAPSVPSPDPGADGMGEGVGGM